MSYLTKSALGFALGCLLLSVWGVAQSAFSGVGPFPFLGELSVIGSDGVFYRVSPNSSGTGSKIEGFSLAPNTKDPFEVLEFSGSASHLNIGKDNSF